jgi:hypothetical protein
MEEIFEAEIMHCITSCSIGTSELCQEPDGREVRSICSDWLSQFSNSALSEAEILFQLLDRVSFYCTNKYEICVT